MLSDNGVGILLGDQRRGVLALTVPLGVALFIQQINSLVDSLWVSGLGSDHLAAVGIVSPVYIAVAGIGSGLGIGISAAVSRYIGKGDGKNANRVASQGFFLTVVISAAITPALLIAAGPMMSSFGAGDTFGLCMEYAVPLYAGSVFIVLTGVMSGLLRGEGAAKRSMYIQGIGAVINMILDPILIFAFGMGISGAAWATVIALGASSVIPFYWYAIRKDTFVRIEAAEMLPDIPLVKEIMNIGFPEMLELSLMSLFNIPLNLFVIMCGGTDAVAVFTTAWKVILLGLIPAQAVGGALISMCSAEYGMRKFDAIKDAFSYSVRVSFIMMIVVSLLIFAFSGPIATVFTLSAESSALRSELGNLLNIMCLFLPSFSLVYTGSSLMQSLRRAGQAMINTVMRNVMIVALFAAVALATADLGSLWNMLVIGEVIGGAMMWLHARMILNDVLRREGAGPGKKLPDIIPVAKKILACFESEHR